MEKEIVILIQIIKVVRVLLIKFRRQGRGRHGRRSLVRVIGSFLPLPSAPRVYINLEICNENLAEKPLRINVSERFQEDRDTCRLGVAESQKLLDEITRQKQKVAYVLSRDQRIFIKREDPQEREQRQLAPEPPPPPLPPPPPPPSQASNSLPLRLNSRPREKNDSGSNKLTAVLRELTNEKPKLKPIIRTPGGRPVRRPPILGEDPSDILSEVLKRRFRAIQDSDESDTSSSFSEAFSPTISPFSTPKKYTKRY